MARTVDADAERIRALARTWADAAARRDLDGMTAIYFEPESITVARSRDLAVVRGSYRFTPDRRRPEQMQAGKFEGVWGLREGDWQLLLNISNSDHPSS